jgi:hypothetical protein
MVYANLWIWLYFCYGYCFHFQHFSHGLDIHLYNSKFFIKLLFFLFVNFSSSEKLMLIGCLNGYLCDTLFVLFQSINSFRIFTWFFSSFSSTFYFFIIIFWWSPLSSFFHFLNEIIKKAKGRGSTSNFSISQTL